MLKPEKTLSTQQIYQGRAVNVRVDTVENASGKRTTREVVEHADCVAVVVLDAQSNVSGTIVGILFHVNADPGFECGRSLLKTDSAFDCVFWEFKGGEKPVLGTLLYLPTVSSHAFRKDG